MTGEKYKMWYFVFQIVLMSHMCLNLSFAEFPQTKKSQMLSRCSQFLNDLPCGRFDHTYLADELMENPLDSRLAYVVCPAAYLGRYNQMVSKLCCHMTIASTFISVFVTS